MPFIGDAGVAVKQIDDSNWELLSPLLYRGNTDFFVVPSGQRTDFASVPRFFVWFLPRYGKYTKAAILHDYLWRELARHGKMRWVDADGIFRRAMRELGVSFLHRWIMWSAVRFAGMLKKGGRKGWHEDLWAAVILTALSLPFVVPAGVVILVSLFGFYVLERIIWIPLAVLSRIRRAERPKQVNAPGLRLTL